VPFEQEYIMFICVRDESTPSLTLNNDDKSSTLKVYRVDEFVDTRFSTAFFPEEHKRWSTLSQRGPEDRSKSLNDAEQISTKRAVSLPTEAAPPSAKL